MLKAPTITPSVSIRTSLHIPDLPPTLSTLNISSTLKDTDIQAHGQKQVMMISKLSFVLFALSTVQVTAFPRINADGIKGLTKLAKKSSECPQLAKRQGCPHLAKNKELKRQTTFDPTSQQVSTAGVYSWIAPGAGDQRGPCPGLNALANHGYLPHNGIADIPTIISAVNTGESILFSWSSQGCTAALLYLNPPPGALYLLLVSQGGQAIWKTTNTNTAYGMGLDLGTFLAVYGTAFDGDPLSADPGYSIGGPATSQEILGLGLLGSPSGLSGSHNNYEADTSPTRGDLYVV